MNELFSVVSHDNELRVLHLTTHDSVHTAIFIMRKGKAVGISEPVTVQHSEIEHRLLFNMSIEEALADVVKPNVPAVEFTSFLTATSLNLAKAVFQLCQLVRS